VVEAIDALAVHVKQFDPLRWSQEASVRIARTVAR
jgi:hypothetical protein